MIIDNHTHVYTLEKYNMYKKRMKGREFKILSLDYFLKHEKVTLDELIAFGKKVGNLFVLANVDMDKNISQQLAKLEKLLKQGSILGIKLYPGYQHFYPSDKKVVPIAKLCQKYNRPLVFHNGDVYDPDGVAELKYSHPMHVDGLATYFPKCKIVISHFGFPYLLETAMVVSKNENVFTDISGTIDSSEDGKNIPVLVKQYQADLIRVFNYYSNVKMKVMYGTDFSGDEPPLNQVEPYIDLIKKIFNSVEQKNVLHGLAEKIYFNK